MSVRSLPPAAHAAGPAKPPAASAGKAGSSAAAFFGSLVAGHLGTSTPPGAAPATAQTAAQPGAALPPAVSGDAGSTGVPGPPATGTADVATGQAAAVTGQAAVVAGQAAAVATQAAGVGTTGAATATPAAGETTGTGTGSADDPTDEEGGTGTVTAPLLGLVLLGALTGPPAAGTPADPAGATATGPTGDQATAVTPGSGVIAAAAGARALGGSAAQTSDQTGGQAGAAAGGPAAAQAAGDPGQPTPAGLAAGLSPAVGTVGGTATGATTVATTTGTTTAATRSAVLDQVLPAVPRVVLRGDGTTRLSLKLHPADLGEVHLTVTVRGHEVDVTMAGGPQAREALAEGSSRLRGLLEGIGHTTGQLVVRDLPAGTGTGGSAQQGPGSQSDPWAGRPGSGDGADLARQGAGHGTGHGDADPRHPAGSPRGVPGLPDDPTTSHSGRTRGGRRTASPAAGLDLTI